MKIEILITSPPDRERLVAELWFGDIEIAEVSREKGEFDVELYGNGISIPLDEYLAALEKAKQELTY